MRNLLAAITWAAALVTVLGAALINPHLMGIAGIVAAVAAIGWGLLTALRDDKPVDPDDELRSRWGTGTYNVTAEIGDGERELPYIAPERRPHWDTNIMGAPE